MQRLNTLSNQVAPQQAMWIMKEVEAFDFEHMGSLKGKTLLITGASRGIGLAIGVKAARDGKSISP